MLSPLGVSQVGIELLFQDPLFLFSITGKLVLTSSDVATVYLNTESNSVLSKPDQFFPFMMKADVRLHCLRKKKIKKKNPIYRSYA